MKPSLLSAHTLLKGEFVTPLNQLPSLHVMGGSESWFYGRVPEYLWIGLIFREFERKEGLKKSLEVVSKLHDLAPTLKTPRMSEILKLDSQIQEKFYDFLLTVIPKKALAPLTVYLTLTRAPVFVRYFFCKELKIRDRSKTITELMRSLSDHQSFESTDIRYIVLFFAFISGLLSFTETELNNLELYATLPHDDERMRSIRPPVRVREMMILATEQTNSQYLREFWDCLSEITECEAYMVAFPKENRDISSYMENLHAIFRYLKDLFLSTKRLDDKMIVLLGIATYSYKQLKECSDHNLFNSIFGRGCVRVLIEDLIMMKYLVKKEAEHKNIWKDYQFYGLGMYKLVLTKHRDHPSSKESHFEKIYIEALVNQYKDEEFLNMDTRYFDKQNIRKKADVVDENKLYGLYYDYDSSYVHGFWGAIRESTLLSCNNPAHKFHCIPDIEGDIRLKTVLPDCIMVMNKTIKFLNEIYGIPSDLMKEVIDFESQLAEL